MSISVEEKKNGQFDLKANWSEIVKFFEKGLKRSGAYTFATVNPDGSPHLAPYGSLVLNGDCSGFYCEVFPNQMARNLARDQRICVMGMNMNMWYFFKGLYVGRFDRWPGIRLSGKAGKIRNAHPAEMKRWLKRVRRFKGLKGYRLLWENIHTVRDIHFTGFEPVHLGTMTHHLAGDWQ